MPPLLLQPAELVYSLHDLSKKSGTPPDIFLSLLTDILSACDDCRRVYTDDSKERAAIVEAAVFGVCVRARRLPDNLSIFTVETEVILASCSLVTKSHVNEET
jgi:hypothetical protein